ncbi:sensor histidine kinase [uncultured Agrococcus sp.]|uniref:sensor histidine kinase n=1 Tax=uncultured Agrococcus sp. TaxID=382258 RepID=UPI0025D8E214|nr:sensor histidine kinase [uncultured Agrococcus sp.]
MNRAPSASTRSASQKDPWERYGWLMAVVWMVFLVYPILELVRSAAPLWLLVLAWAGLVAFAAAYVIGFVVGMRSGWGRPPRAVFVAFFLLMVFGGATLPVLGWYSLSFLPFIMSYAAYGLRGAWHWTTTVTSVALAGSALLALGPSGGVLPIFAIVCILAVVNSINTWLISRSVQADKLRLDLATSREREAIARDVHDLIGHTLTVVKLKSELAERLVDRDPDAAKRELEAISSLTAEAIAGVRSTVTGLRASELDEQLEASRSALASAGVELRVEGTPEAMSPAQSLSASWIVREAVTNILRHAGATRVNIELKPGTLTVVDDGRGVEGPAGNGLRGMAERASASGAVLAVEDGADGGTAVSVRW